MKKTLTFLLLLAGGTCFGQKSKLQLNLKLDSIYNLTNNVSMTVVEDMPGQKQVMTIVLNGKVSHKVVAIRDSVYELAIAYENVSMVIELGGRQLMNVNTSLKGQDIMSKIMTGMLHKPMTMLVTKRGKVLEIKNSEAIYAHMFDDFPQISDDKKAQLSGQMQKSFGDKTLKNNFQDAFAVLPDSEVGINDSWVSKSSMDAAVVRANIKTTYVLKGITGDACIIHGDAVLESAGVADYAELNGIPVRLNNTSGSYTADIKLDKETGWISEAKITKNIKGDAEIKDSPKVPGGMKFPLSLSGDITLNDK